MLGRTQSGGPAVRPDRKGSEPGILDEVDGCQAPGSSKEFVGSLCVVLDPASPPSSQQVLVSAGLAQCCDKYCTCMRKIRACSYSTGPDACHLQVAYGGPLRGAFRVNVRRCWDRPLAPNHLILQVLLCCTTQFPLAGVNADIATSSPHMCEEDRRSSVLRG